MTSTPVWRIVVSYMVLLFAVQRVGQAAMLSLGDAGWAPVISLALQAAAALVLWAGMRWKTALIVPALVATGALFAVGALVSGFVGAIPSSFAVMQALFAAGATAAFAFLMRKGLEDDANPRPPP